MRSTTSFCSMKCMSRMCARGFESETAAASDVVWQVSDQPQRSLVVAQCRENRPSAHRLRDVGVPRTSGGGAGAGSHRDRVRYRSAAHRARSNGTVIAPRPGPISTRCSPGSGATAAMMRAITCGSCRRCWPKRLRADARQSVPFTPVARRRGGGVRPDRAHGRRPRLQAGGRGATAAGQIEGRAVIDRGADHRQGQA